MRQAPARKVPEGVDGVPAAAVDGDIRAGQMA
jgi:hypothetical protein